MELFRKTLGPVKKALEDASFKKSDLDEIVLVGGSTRIPKVRECPDRPVFAFRSCKIYGVGGVIWMGPSGHVPPPPPHCVSMLVLTRMRV